MFIKNKVIAGVLGMFITSEVFAQTSIQYGESRYDGLECGVTLSYSLNAADGDRVVAMVTECSDYGGICKGYACFCFGQCMRLYDSSEYLIDTACAPNGNNTQNQYRSIIRREITSSELYALRVNDVDDLGRGSVGVSILNVGNTDGSTELDQTSFEVFTINVCGEADKYHFTSDAKSVISIVMEIDEGSVIRPTLELYDPLGRLIRVASDGRLLQQLPISGTYVVLAYSATSETGGYRMLFNPSGTTTTTTSTTTRTSTTTQTTIVVTSTLPLQCHLCGDLDNSGSIVASDALRLLSIAVGIPATAYCPGYCPVP